MTENIDKLLSEQAQASAQRTYEIAVQNRHSTVEVVHVLLALLDAPDEPLEQVLQYLSLDIERLKQQTWTVLPSLRKVPFWKGQNYQLFVTPQVRSIIPSAIALAKEQGREKTSAAHILWAVAASGQEYPNVMATILKENDVTPERINEALVNIEYYSNNDNKTSA